MKIDDQFDSRAVTFYYYPEKGKHRPRKVAVKVKPIGTGGSAPEIDTGTFELKKTLNIEYLRIKKDTISVLQDTIVMELEVSPDLIDRSDFIEKIRHLVEIRVEANSKPDKQGRRVHLRGKFLVKIEPILKVRWRAELQDIPPEVTTDADNRPIVLPPDGFSKFRLEVWAAGLESGVWKDQRGKFEFSHWLAPKEKSITTKIITPEPHPANFSPDDTHEITHWRSGTALPDPVGHPELSIPLETYLRVKVWNLNVIARHFKDRVELFKDKNEPELLSEAIPILLVHEFMLELEVYLIGDNRHKAPLDVHEVTVNGENVKVNCPLLPLDLKAKLRWRVTGPRRIFRTNRKFMTEYQEVQLVRTRRKNGSETLGAGIRLSEGGKSIAIPEVDLPTELIIEPEIEMTVSKDWIKGDERDSANIKAKIIYTRKSQKILDHIYKLESYFSDDSGGEIANPQGAPTGDHTKLESPHGAEAEVAFKWVEKEDTQTTIRVCIEFWLAARDPDVEPYKVEDTITIKVKAANPQLSYKVDPSTADADGMMIITVKPELVLFGELNEEVRIIHSVTQADPFFEVVGGSPDPSLPQLYLEPSDSNSEKGLQLRCKFHLRDEELRKIELEGGAALDLKIKLLDEHYARHYPNGIKQEIVQRIMLRPSVVHCESPNPNALPQIGLGRLEWVSFLAAQARSASGKEIPGSVIVSDRTGGIQPGSSASNLTHFPWKFHITVPDPPKGWGIPGQKGGEHSEYIAGIDERGIMLFKDDQGSSFGQIQTMPYYAYNHWDRFWDPWQRILKGAGTSLTVIFDAQDVISPAGNIQIEGPDEKTMIIKVLAQSGEALEGADVRIVGSDGKERLATTNADGQATFKDITEEDGPFQVRASRQGILKEGRGRLAIREGTADVKQKRMHEIVLPCSSQWAISQIIEIAGSYVTAGFQSADFHLVNEGKLEIRGRHEKIRRLQFTGPWVGVSAKFIGAAKPLFMGKTYFSLRDPVMFEDFNGSGEIVTEFEVGMVVGYCASHINFDKPNHTIPIDTGGWQLTSPKGGLGVAKGDWMVFRSKYDRG